MPDELIAAATTKQWGIGVPGRGYGYQWWSNDDGSFAAQGIFGQGIFIDPKRKLVIASNGNWPTATDPEGVGAARERTEEHTSELQSLMRNPYDGFGLNKKSMQNQTSDKT